MKKFRFYFGLTLWCMILLLILLTPMLFSENPWVRAVQGVRSFVVSERQAVEIEFESPLFVHRGDPIFMVTQSGLKRIGQLVEGDFDANGLLPQLDSAKAEFFGDAPPITKNCYLTLHETPASFEWAAKRLFPEERRKKIVQDLQTTFAEHQQEIIQKFSPIVADTVREVAQVLQEDLKKAIEENRPQLTAIASRYQETFVKNRLVPLVKRVIWPIIEKRTQPVIDRVGSKIWKRASLWRFGWRLAYDKLSLTNSNLLQQEWNRFVKNDAVPILEEHVDEFYQLAQQILTEIGENAEVKAAMKEGVDQVLGDQELKGLIKTTLWKIFFENDRLKEVIRRNLSSDRTQKSLRETSDKFEDKLRNIGDELFGTFQKGITREFAGVLRKEILRRDHRWFILRYHSAKSGEDLRMADKIKARFQLYYDHRPEFVMEPEN